MKAIAEPIRQQVKKMTKHMEVMMALYGTPLGVTFCSCSPKGSARSRPRAKTCRDAVESMLTVPKKTVTNRARAKTVVPALLLVMLLTMAIHGKGLAFKASGMLTARNRIVSSIKNPAT